MAQPRVAVVGGGIAGTLCSLVLRNRGASPVILDAGRNGVGGRLRGGAQHDGGAQFFRASDPRLISVMNLLQQNSMVAKWEGRFGMLGSKSGGFLPNEIVGATAQQNEKDNKSDTITCANATSGGDFCGFVTHNSRGPAYVGIPHMMNLCPSICEMAGIEVHSDARVVGAETVADVGGWRLSIDGQSVLDEPAYDALVIATHDPTIASTIVHDIAQREQEASIHDTKGDCSISDRLFSLADALKGVREAKRPVITFSILYPEGSSDNLPYDAVSVHGSPMIQFLARQASKPGRLSKDRDLWTGVSTIEFAEYFMAENQQPKAESMLAQEVSRLVATYFGGDTASVPKPKELSSKLWRAGFQGKTLDLLEDSVTLAPWRLAICGDFISKPSRHATPLEAAALSGLEAGERVATFFQQGN